MGPQQTGPGQPGDLWDVLASIALNLGRLFLTIRDRAQAGQQLGPPQAQQPAQQPWQPPYAGPPPQPRPEAPPQGPKFPA
jgi:hypothetical protein